MLALSPSTRAKALAQDKLRRRVGARPVWGRNRMRVRVEAGRIACRRLPMPVPGRGVTKEREKLVAKPVSE